MLDQNIDASRPAFVPTMPPRLPEATPIWTKLMKSRDNLVAGWTEDCFTRKVFDFSILNQRYIVCNSAASVRQVFLENHTNYDRKSPQMRRALSDLLGDGLFVSDGALWRQRRDACAPSLHSEHLPAYIAVMVATTLETADRWAASEGRDVDVLEEMAHLTARIIGRTVFGDDTPADEAHRVVRGFSRYVRAIEQMDLAASLGLEGLSLFTNPVRTWTTRRAAREIHDVIDRIIERHRANPGRRADTLLAHFLNPQPTGSDGDSDDAPQCPFSDRAARNEAIVMFMAGHETTANTLTWAFYLLAAVPDWRDALHRELDEVLGGREPGPADVGRLVVTRAIIEETLRLYPPVPVLSRQARGPDRIAKTDVREGDIILVVPWLLHRHDHYWAEPNAFRPERFLPGRRRPDRFLYLPFSAGHRVCLGQRFGLTEAILCLAILANRFRLDLAPGRNVEVSCRLTLRPEGGLPMRIAARD